MPEEKESTNRNSNDTYSYAYPDTDTNRRSIAAMACRTSARCRRGCRAATENRRA